MSTTSHALNVRIPEEMLRRVDGVRQRLARQLPGATRTDAVRMVLQKGLELLDAEGMLAQEEGDWLGSDLSRLGEFEPYDFGGVIPDELGQPLIRRPNGTFVVELAR